MANLEADKVDSLPVVETSETQAGYGGKNPLLNPQFTKLITYAGIAILAVSLGLAGRWYYMTTQNEEAQKEMFHATFAFEADSLNKALNGGAHPGFLSIIKEYGSTKAANEAHFYAGAIYLKQGKYQLAIDQLSSFSSSDVLVEARAYSLQGDANSELGNKDEAITYYLKAANYKPNKYFTPTYLLKAAIVQEENKDLDGAVKSYSTILDKYYDSAEAADAKKYKARAIAMLGK